MKPTLSFLAALALCSGSLFSADPATMLPNEWTEFRYERFAVLKSNEALAAENKALTAELDAQTTKVEAAMIQVDPSVEPIINKVATLVRTDWGTPPENSEVSAADWQKLRTARATALEKNPELATTNKALLEKKRLFEAKVDAALLQADPGLAPLLKKLQAREQH